MRLSRPNHAQYVPKTKACEALYQVTARLLFAMVRRRSTVRFRKGALQVSGLIRILAGGPLLVLGGTLGGTRSGPSPLAGDQGLVEERYGGPGCELVALRNCCPP